MAHKIGLGMRTVRRALMLEDGSYDSIRIIINTRDAEERDRLTERWQTHKLEELNFVGIVGALLASCLTSTGDWPNVLGNGRTQPWTVKTCWFAGILFALFTVLIVAQQSMSLHRLCAHRDGLQRFRDCMTHPNLDKDGAYRPRRLRVQVWQIGPLFLAASVFCMIGGMGIMLWVGTRVGPYKSSTEPWWDSNAKMATTWTIMLAVAISGFLVSQRGLIEH
ncbi:uncharacterized protein RCC_08948 [Ramularia collo-cygni]|uniref:Uncharacterized protein n=1 Tax=Ramularia collo-cygni TaxID=112498 RepID=A0A2D3UYW0_9PEZI|nr:uncharacterized protein RCC_08948 [Ramularia collo-cygni]CZT23237.1 uncharacterized protein RCC_08948 [Ramularia collo-cygni]